MTDRGTPSHGDAPANEINVADTACPNLEVSGAEETDRRDRNPQNQEEAPQERDSLLNAGQVTNNAGPAKGIRFKDPSSRDTPRLAIHYWWSEFAVILCAVGLLTAITTILSLADSDIQST